MTSAAIYARVSSARQKEQETIVSQTEALRAHGRQLGLDVPEEWVFEDDGHSGASLVRPALDALRDLVAQVPVDVVLCYSPDRLARKYAYQALLMEELARAGTSVVFLKAPSGNTPEDALLVQFQGMIAEYERAQIMERTRRGKNQRARSGSVNVLSGAPFGYRYVRKSDHAAARYEIVPHEAAIVAGLFRRYADEGIAIAELARWLGSTGVTTRTGKARWDRSTIWGMLRNPAYAGRACFGKTSRVSEQAGRNRVARLAGRATGTAYTTMDRPRADWLEIDVPALVDEATFERAARRLADNKKFASRASKTPSLLQGLAACSGCGYACYRGHTTTSAGNKIFYYRCIGSDNYRFEHGKVCDSKPVRADYLDQVVWDHITGLLTDPSLIRTEIGKRLTQIRTADPATAQHKRLDDALAKTTSASTRLIGAYQEDLVSLDELRARMPELRARETSLRHQIQALDAQLADREVYLKLAENLEGFLATLRKSAATAAVEDRQRVVRLLVKEILVSPAKIVIRHSIPTRADVSATVPVSTDSDADAEPAPGSHLRWRSHHSALRSSLAGRSIPPPVDHSSFQPFPDLLPGGERANQAEKMIVVDSVKCGFQVRVKYPYPVSLLEAYRVVDSLDRVVAAAARPEPVLPGIRKHSRPRRWFGGCSVT
jgi:site-specific DNA recombinase